MYAVLGDPISHSLSPKIFSLFAEQARQSIDYRAIQVRPENLAASLADLSRQGYRGVNLTAPLKERVLPLVKTLSPAARAAHAVNVLSIQPDGSYQGHNSDGLGFIRDLQNKNALIQGSSILILGAGGAARGLIAPLLQEKPQQIMIYNRTEEKARQLIADFQGNAIPLALVNWQALTQHRFDLIIHCTTLGLQGEKLPFPKEILKPQTFCYDLSYGKAALPFLSWAREQGVAACHDGLGMLVEQAAEAFFLWRGHKIDTIDILQKLAV